ncbi:hypothetical protein IV417_16555 [Alphaproteobacteria bacterium KMM 3653]|uniref:Tripartite tricarboxylate transporter TctB family protein n=2 Tax=Harenicola maris TaxID=2841044 RepID=A0AAP2CSQ7_9RHOB|nr:hypothetical protein [Harenicola maris]
MLRARDFWGALVLICCAVFFLWRTSFIPFLGENRAGVSGAEWYNSAAIVPFGIWLAMLLLGLVLLRISIKAGGAERAFSGAGLGWNRQEAIRIRAIAVIMSVFIFALIPRVDFILSSGLVITALIYGFHAGHTKRMLMVAVVVALPGLYALIMHFPQAEWNKPHDDDWVVLAAWVLLTVWMLARDRSRIARATPWVAVLTPLILVTAMAFGFRQNVPNRGGLLFSQIEYHYYVNLRPLWRK